MANKDYEVVLEGEVGEGHRGDIAVDDVSLSDDCVKAKSNIPGHINNTNAPPQGKSNLPGHINNTDTPQGEFDL